MATTRKVLGAEMSANNHDWIITIEFTHLPGWLRRTFLRTKKSKKIISYIGACTVWNHYPSFVPVHDINMEFYLCSVWKKAEYKYTLEKKEKRNEL
jgi:hypothetical protein